MLRSSRSVEGVAITTVTIVWTAPGSNSIGTVRQVWCELGLSPDSQGLIASMWPAAHVNSKCLD